MENKVFPAWQHEVTLPIIDKVYGAGRVHAGIHYIPGNRHPYFSVTCSFNDSGGCMHETVLKHYPVLAPVVALHLSDDTGTPMHALANGQYHAGFTDGMSAGFNLQFLAEHLRITQDEAIELVKQGKENFREYVNAQGPRWASEAAHAIKILEQLQVK